MRGRKQKPIVLAMIELSKCVLLPAIAVFRLIFPKEYTIFTDVDKVLAKKQGHKTMLQHYYNFTQIHGLFINMVLLVGKSGSFLRNR